MFLLPMYGGLATTTEYRGAQELGLSNDSLSAFVDVVGDEHVAAAHRVLIRGAPRRQASVGSGWISEPRVSACSNWFQKARLCVPVTSRG